ncbi:MAG: caspase family protein [Proteobacteria bacterium]|nr:caspase family protein [Pseudomonadota bacterium]
MKIIADKISMHTAPRYRKLGLLAFACLSILFSGCESTTGRNTSSTAGAQNSDASQNFYIVDCLLPGQVRKLGASMTFVTQRQPIKTSQSDCEIRGGEYVSYDRADYATALRIWLPMAQAGDAVAQTYVGEIYEKGLGLTADYTLAAQWYDKASEQGDSRAKINLGHLYEKGLGVKQDQETALNLYRSASGLAADKLMFASTLSSNYVPRGEYESVQQELAEEQRQSDQLKAKLNRVSGELNKQSSALSTTQSDMRATQAKLEVALTTQASTTQPNNSAEDRELQANVAQIESARANLEQQVAQLQLQNKELGRNQRALAEQLSSNETGKNQNQKKIAQLEQQLSRSKQGLNQSEQKLAETRQQLREQQSRETALTPKLITLQSELEDKNRALTAERVKLAQLQAERQSLEQSSDKKVAQHQQRITGLENELTQAKQQVSRSESDVAGLQASLQQQSRQVDLSPALLSLQNELDERNQVLREEKARFATLETRSRSERQQLSQALAAMDKKSQQLTSDKSSYAQEKSRLDSNLLEREQQMDDMGHELLLARASLHMERASSDKALATQAEEHQSALQGQHNELQQLATQLETQRTLVKSQEQQISRLQREEKSYQQELASGRTSRQTPLAVAENTLGIEIIEPPVVLTRSLATVRIRKFQGEREVIGKISTQAGLLSLSVNGQATEITDNNLFRYSVPLVDDPTPVQVIAVDNDGRRAMISFSFVEQSKGSNGAPPSRPTSEQSGIDLDIPMGNYHALIIGNNEYQNFSTLKTAVNDARETEKVLRQKYNFTTTLLLNADRYTILSALNDLREKLDKNDNLLIYYAGHGKLDDENKFGYWLPVDADQDNNINWISNEAITNILNVIEAKHVLVVADSCYAGTLTQTPIARVQMDIPDDVRAEWMKVMAQTRARLTFTSGGVEPVLDGGGGKHSVFAKAFIGALRNNDQVLEGFSLYSRVLELMPAQASTPGQSQAPQYAPIHLAGHESGEFFFTPG